MLILNVGILAVAMSLVMSPKNPSRNAEVEKEDKTPPRVSYSNSKSIVPRKKGQKLPLTSNKEEQLDVIRGYLAGGLRPDSYHMMQILHFYGLRQINKINPKTDKDVQRIYDEWTEGRNKILNHYLEKYSSESSTDEMFLRENRTISREELKVIKRQARNAVDRFEKAQSQEK